MKKLRGIFSCNNGPRSRSENPSHSLLSNEDVREEYANAFRTESYNEFWCRVLAISSNGGDDAFACKPPIESSSTACRLPSYRLFVEYLLDPTQPTVTHILDSNQIHTKYRALLSSYFSNTAEASILCGILLKSINRTRLKYRSVKMMIQSLHKGSQVVCISDLLTRLNEFSNSSKSSLCSTSTSNRFRAMRTSCSELTRKLESSRDKAREKSKTMNRFKHGSALILVGLTASLMVIVAVHALALVVAAPCLLATTLEVTTYCSSIKGMNNVANQLDAAAKGTYILSRDLDTISSLVARLNDELGSMGHMVRFWLDRGEDRLQADGEVVRQLKLNDSSFRRKLDELEEHLYLCFMTINRARNLVVKQILDPGLSTKAPNLLSI